jgi:hypothetical protein
MPKKVLRDAQLLWFYNLFVANIFSAFVKMMGLFFVNHNEFKIQSTDIFCLFCFWLQACWCISFIMIVSIKGGILSKTQGLSYDRDALANEWAVWLDCACRLSKLTRKLVLTNSNSLHLLKKLPAAVLMFIQSVLLQCYSYSQFRYECGAGSRVVATAVLAINQRPLLLL